MQRLCTQFPLPLSNPMTPFIFTHPSPTLQQRMKGTPHISQGVGKWTHPRSLGPTIHSSHPHNSHSSRTPRSGAGPDAPGFSLAAPGLRVVCCPAHWPEPDKERDMGEGKSGTAGLAQSHPAQFPSAKGATASWGRAHRGSCGTICPTSGLLLICDHQRSAQPCSAKFEILARCQHELVQL